MKKRKPTECPTESTDDLRMVGDLLWAQDHFGCIVWPVAVQTLKAGLIKSSE